MATDRRAMRLLQKFGTLGALVVLAAAFAIASPGAFGTLSNLINVTQQMALLTIVAVGATFVMAVGEFDLSVAANISLSSIMVLMLLLADWPLAGALPATLAATGVAGIVAGLLVARFAVPSFIATLALGTVVEGVTFWLSGGATLFGSLPHGFRVIGNGSLLGLPVLTLWMLAAVLFGYVFLDHLEIGRRFYAIGGSREAARLGGVPVRRDTIMAFMLSGLLAGVVGVLLAARLGSATPTGGGGFLLQAYAAVFLGMTAFREGEPNVPGTVVGTAIIALLANGLTILDVPNFVQDMLTGGIIIAAVLLRGVGRRRD